MCSPVTSFSVGIVSTALVSKGQTPVLLQEMVDKRYLDEMEKSRFSTSSGR
jgi:hypothetical protein